MTVSGESNGSKVLATCFAAALGAAFGNLAYLAVLHSMQNPAGWLQLAVIAPVMYLASRSFLDPLSGALRQLIGLPPPDAQSVQPTGRGLWALAAGAVVMIIWLADAIQKYTEIHPLSVVLMIAMSILMVGGMTFGWIAGARRRWPMSWLYGALAGFFVNGVATFAILLAQRPDAAPSDVAEVSAASGLSVGLAGLAGGLAVDLALGRRPSFTAPLLALIAFCATGAVGIWVLGSTTLDGVLPNIFLGLGWILGLASSPLANQVLCRRDAV